MMDVREIAKKLITDKKIDFFVGFKKDKITEKNTPYLFYQADQCDQMVFDDTCEFNLAAYVSKKEVSKDKKIGLVVRPKDMRSVLVLVQENQMAEDQLLMVPVVDGKVLSVMTAKEASDWLQQNTEKLLSAEDALLIKLEGMTAKERWNFFQKEFSKCIKCYACRAACPLCYCHTCVVEKNQPQWISPSSHQIGNMSWNITRAFHLASRCTGCGNCEAACPVGIPLMLLNKKLAKVVKENFEYVSGLSTEKGNALLSYKENDKEEFYL